MFTLIRNVQVFAPSEIGQQDLLLVGDRIIRMAPDLASYESLPDDILSPDLLTPTCIF
jgi:hypothetical protein